MANEDWGLYMFPDLRDNSNDLRRNGPLPLSIFAKCKHEK